MALRLPYSRREYQTALEEIKSSLRDDVNGINDFLESNAGRFLLDSWAAIADMVNFVVERQGAECYIDTLEERASLISLLKLIGFQPMNPVPDQVLTTLTIASPAIGDQVVQRYTKLIATTADGRPIPFVTASSATIPDGESTSSVIALQGEWKPLLFTSNGSRNQAYLINSLNVADGYIRVWVNSVEWTRANDNTFVGHAAADEVFRIINTSDKRSIVEFGTGFEGRIPPIGNQVRIEYLDTLHVNGRIKTGELRYAESNVSSLTPYNEKPSAGGLDFETIDSARSRYPVAFKADRRCVTLGDWEALAALVPGVMQAKAIDLNIDPSLPFFMVRLYVIGNGGLVSEALNRQVAEALRSKRVNATVFEVLSPTEITTSVRGQIYVLRSYNKEDVLANVNTAIADFFEMTSDSASEVRLGVSIPYSRLIATIQAVPGVSHLVLTEPESDVNPNTNEFVRLDTIDIRVAGVV